MDNRELSAGLRARVALEKFGFRNAHALGQNFLLDEGLLNALLDAAEVGGDDFVVEIGPGAGVMTALLADRCREVLAVELDRKLEPVLQTVLAGHDNARVVFQDFMKADLNALVGQQPYRVVANLPYYITADILLKLVCGARRPESVCIMVQKEAAERIMSRPGAKQWCALAAMVQYYGTPSVLMDVPPEAFDPPPHVMSQFLRIDRHPSPEAVPGNEATFFRLVNAAFAMRRKTLANNLKASFGMDQGTAQRVLEAAGMDPRVRGEALSLRELCRVSDVIDKGV